MGERQGNKIGCIRLKVITDCSSDSLLSFIEENIEPGSSISIDGWKSYQPLDPQSYRHNPVIRAKAEESDSVLPGVHLVASLVKRMIRGTHQGRYDPRYLQNY